MVVINPGDLNRMAGTFVRRRSMLGMTQEVLAEKAGVSLSTVAMIESGKRLPSLVTLLSIVSALDWVLKLEADPALKETSK